MADDPNRDILPVKEGSCVDTIISAIDPRERHLVCKLDRYQLEDKYLRLLDEASNLKKLSNCQEDKIKRLGTKLIRLAGNPRLCGLTLDIADDKNRTAALELENTKLKEKIAVMKNQLLSHTMSGRSSSRSRNLVRPSSSGIVTCRSENNRVRAPSCQCIVGAGDDDNDIRNYLVKIEKLEAQKKDMTCRIIELEKELAYLTNNQKEKVAENVEYIRVWRQMKQLNDKLMTTQEKNTALTTEINDLKTTLVLTTKNNQEIVAVLSSERTRIAEIDDQMLKAKTSQFILREKDEQIRDLMNEIKILQQHNNELIMLTSKYGQFEVENIELKKRLCDDTQEQQILKTAFNIEQVNIIALKATNERLLAKLQELQANIDVLTIQLTSLHTQDKKQDFTITVPSGVEQCKKCCEMYDKIIQLEKTVGNTREDWQSADKSVQTIVITSTREQDTMIISNNEDKTSSQSPLKEWKKNQEANGTSVLSREKILKLLDQAQINTPLDASRITPKKECAGILDVAQRHRQVVPLEKLLFGQMFLILFDVMQEFLSFTNVDGKLCLDHQVSAVEDPLIDVNNNLPTKTIRDIKQRDFNTGATKDFESDRCTSCSLKSTAFYSKNCNFACKKKPATILASSSMKNIFDATSCRMAHRKSSYRDISKDVCAEKMVKIKRLKSPRYPKCNLTCHLRKAKDPLSLQEKRKLPCTTECLNDSIMLPMCPMDPLLITDRQGLIEIHISRLQLSTSVTNIPDEDDICSLHIYVSWDVWGEKTAYTPRMKCPNLIFNSSCVYRITDLFSFFKNVLSEYLIFRVNIVRRDGTSYTFARAKVSIKDILDYPQNKLHYIVPVNSVICSFFGVNFGQLSLWVRLSCNVDMVEAFKKQGGISSLKDIHAPSIKKNISKNPLPQHSTKHIVDIVSFRDRQQKDSSVFEDSNTDTQAPLDSNFQYETENSDEENFYVNSNNEELPINETNEMFEEENGTIAMNPDYKTDKSKESKENNVSRDSPSVAEFKTLLANKSVLFVNYRDSGRIQDISLLEGSNSTIRDMDEILSDRNWERYKQRSLLTFARANSLNVEAQDYQNGISICRNEKDAIIIEIVSIQFFDDSCVMQDDQIHLLYVEYSFLEKHGEDMETISMEKPKTSAQEMVYNYKKKFWINEVTHPIQRENLRAMLAEDISPNINFTVISEPLPEEREVKDCEEVGHYATFNIKKYALGDECKYMLLPIKDNQNREIGTLKVIHIIHYLFVNNY
ncbi:Protein fantom [Trachymyrmex cornetzi]|uniref:Protein fantom n=1 Tax=Trachymyrmex cornetzi TaxID=471704 RepID=A0A151JBT7_9HYME|nr:Protein fantom [Trachymyrmex cornetzi]